MLNTKFSGTRRVGLAIAMVALLATLVLQLTLTAKPAEAQAPVHVRADNGSVTADEGSTVTNTGTFTSLFVVPTISADIGSVTQLPLITVLSSRGPGPGLMWWTTVLCPR